METIIRHHLLKALLLHQSSRFEDDTDGMKVSYLTPPDVYAIESNSPHNDIDSVYWPPMPLEIFYAPFRKAVKKMGKGGAEEAAENIIEDLNMELYSLIKRNIQRNAQSDSMLWEGFKRKDGNNMDVHVKGESVTDILIYMEEHLVDNSMDGSYFAVMCTEWAGKNGMIEIEEDDFKIVLDKTFFEDERIYLVSPYFFSFYNRPATETNYVHDVKWLNGREKNLVFDIVGDTLELNYIMSWRPPFESFDNVIKGVLCYDVKH